MSNLSKFLRASVLAPACAVVAMMACQNPVDLTEKPKTFVDPANYFTNAAEAINAANGMYTPLMSWDNWINPAWQEVSCEGVDVMCPDWFAWGTNGPKTGPWYAGRTWTANYAIIRRANDLLGQLEGSSLDATLVSRLSGEAHFLRGQSYLELVRRYGAVPLRLSAYVPDGTYGEIARAPIAEVYATIVKDLKAAASELPTNYSSKTYSAADRGRPIAASANGLLTRTYLTMAGKEANLGSVYYDSARKAAQLVMAATNVKLESDYMRNFEWSTQIMSDEVLWQIGATHRENTGPEVGGFYDPNDDLLVGGGADGHGGMRTPFYQTFEPNDLRVRPGVAVFDHWNEGASSTAPGTYTYSRPAVPDSIKTQLATATQTGWTWSDGGTCDSNGVNFYTLQSGRKIGISPKVFTMKYVDRTALTKSQNSSNPVILRFADVLLMFAEAENEVAGPTPAAYEAINRVRTRAELPRLEVAKPGLSKDTFRDAVWMERRHEFFAEFQEWFDYKRQGRYLDLVNNRIPPYPGAVNPSTPTCKTRQSYQLVLPLPDAEFSSNKLVSQNPGY